MRRITQDHNSPSLRFLLLYDPVDLPDAVAMACAVWDGFAEETTLCSASCLTEPGETYGMVIFYKDGFTYDSMPKTGKANVSVVSRAKKTEFVPRLLAVLRG